MISKIRIIGVVIGTAIIVSCQSKKIPDNFDYGTVENNVYTNSFFDMSINVPPDWKIQSDEQTEALMDMGQDMVAGENSKMKAMLKASEVNSAYLLTVFEHEVGSVVTFNPSFMLLAENLQMFSGINTGQDYLEASKKLMRQSQINYNYIDDEFTQVTLGNQQFYEMSLELSQYGVDIQQSYYSMIKNGFSFNIIISYTDEQQKADLEAVLSTLKFSDY